jgi:signal transduction histidine kinase
MNAPGRSRKRGAHRVRRAAADDAWQGRRLARALLAAGLGLWTWSLADDRMGLSARARLLLGLVGAPRPAGLGALLARVHPEDIEQVWACDAAVRAGRPHHGVVRVRSADGWRWLSNDACVEVDAGGRPWRALGVLADITSQKQAEDALRRAHDALEARVQERTETLLLANNALANEVAERRATEQQVRELLGQLVSVEEEERRRVARELHDTVGQHLTALTVGLKLIEDDPALPPTLCERLARLQHAVRSLDGDVERLSHRLRPAALDDLGLEAALQQHAKEWSQDSGIEVSLLVRGLRGRRWPAALETTAFRTVQEALTNVRRHAAARQVSLIVERRGSELSIVIEDDGCGFDVASTRAQAAHGSGLGLRGMAERARLAGGRVELESEPGRGTTLFVALPLDDEAA